MASVVMAVFLAISLNSLEEGTWDYMLGNMITQYNGYVQVQHEGYFDEPSINNAMPMWAMDSLPEGIRNVTDMAPRLESFALLATDTRTRGGMVVGIDPQHEDNLTGLADKLVDGSYLEPGDRALLLGNELATLLQVGVGDTLVLLGQGYHGANAVGKYPIKGLVKYNIVEMNKNIVLLPIAEAQHLFAAEGLATAMLLKLKNESQFRQTTVDLNATLPDDLVAMHWRELMPEIVQAMQADKGGSYIMQGIIYLIIAFGIFTTVLMMTAERMREFGVLLAVGMKRWRMRTMVVLEMMVLALLGVITGAVLSFPLVYYINQNPIHIGGDMAQTIEEYGFEPIYITSIAPVIFYSQIFIILGITLLVMLYPMWKLSRIDAVHAMRS